ncbi:MMPL family transporter [Cohnella terricola]|uniref:MMPL family transporter n=1 Tax=Cohnella terricola TaxID=1289167 RepID=A0A559JEJ0_9BACL|nr:MMPL family transporter [Cohnella terricola]TVX98304.1 MMPL family transporter [Cohnella terricola]
MDIWIRWIAKLRWVVVAAWLAAGSLAIIALPNLQDVLRTSEQKFLPAEAGSVQATHLLQNITPNDRSLSSAVIVFSRSEGLTRTDQEWIDGLMDRIDSEREEIGVTSVVSAGTQPEIADRLLSKDGSTRIAIVNLPHADFDEATKTTLGRLKELLKDAPEGSSALLTGSAPLSQDFQQSAESGLRRTEMLTVGFVVLILLFLFRSPIAAVIPLLTIGTSFVLARGIVGICAQFGVPVSHFSESFLIAVLFGAGTDYCILLILRYREELSAGNPRDRIAALSRTMSGVGATIVYSAATVFAAFLLLGLAEFGLYRSAVGVAVGMLVTVAAALTLAPALLLVFGKAAFWPDSGAAGSQRRLSRLWETFASLARKRSVAVLLAAVIGLTPLTLLYEGKRSFDDISEINPNLPSVSGFRQAEKAFGAGELFPVTIVVTAKQSMRTTSGLAALEQASTDLTRLDDVREVRSAVRPLGRKPDELTVPGQLRKPNVAELIQTIVGEQESLIDGLKTIALSSAPLSQGLLGIASSVKQLQSGLSQLIVSQLGGLKRLNDSSGERHHAASERALDYYISPDGRTAKIELILDSNPYSDRALDTVPLIMEKLQHSLNATWLEDPQAYAAGISAKYGELRDISLRDFVRTGVWVLIGIALLLMLLLRSFVAPLYVLLSLGLNYLITMGILEFLFVKGLGYDGLSWTVSFFVFIIIVALGVDYGIFLMARFKEEYRPGQAAAAMTTAMRSTGGVIGSSAVIMGGTFGALAFSGVDTLAQIGVGALIGLLLYATLFMGLIVPACACLLGDANWRPFHRVRNPR